MVENQNKNELNTWSLLYVMKSPVTRQKYQKRLEKFFDFLGLEGKRRFLLMEQRMNVMIRLLTYLDNISYFYQGIYNNRKI